MFLEKKDQTKYTIGKYLRGLKRLRKKDAKAKRIPMNQELQQYKEHLQKQGLIANSLDLGLFQTKNGLKYPGFIATQDIPTNSVLLRVPVDCLLTTRDAFVSQIQKVYEQNPLFYSKTFSSDWQDRILLTFLLFEYQKKEQSKWYHVIRNLPKEIDYVVFWQEKQLQALQDFWVKKSIAKERQKVEKQHKKLIQIAKKYPQFFDMDVFTLQNMIWIHVHLVTRCFGKYFQYTTMVPYAELFNHECIDVYYTMAYDQDNPHNPNQVLDPPRYITSQEADAVESSDGSYDASDVSASDEEFQDEFFGEVEISQIPEIQSQIRSLYSYLTAFISFNDGVSLGFLFKTYEYIEEIKLKEVDLVSARVKLGAVHLNNVKYLKLVKEFYHKISYNTYKYGLRQKKKWSQKNKKEEEAKVDPNERYFEGAWPKDKFDEFLMICSSKDQFQEGSQVYFCYGRLPNRLLLMRYGFALEHNKYNHMFIRVDISSLVQQNKIFFKHVINDINLKKYRKFKVKRSAFCTEILIFHRAFFWNYTQDLETVFYIKDIQRQLKVLKIVQYLYDQKLKSYASSTEQNEKKLQDKSIMHHEYFAIVYKLEQQRILEEQIKMITYARSVLNSIGKGKKLQNILKYEKDEMNIRYQLMMEVYFRYFNFQKKEK